MTTFRKSAEQFPRIKNEILKIEKEISGIRLVDDRAEKLEGIGYSVDTFPMGSGGVGQVREMKDHYRIQIGYGVALNNYAKAVVIQK